MTYLSEWMVCRGVCRRFYYIWLALVIFTGNWNRYQESQMNILATIKNRLLLKRQKIRIMKIAYYSLKIAILFVYSIRRDEIPTETTLLSLQACKIHRASIFPNFCSVLFWCSCLIFFSKLLFSFVLLQKFLICRHQRVMISINVRPSRKFLISFLQ